MEMLEDRRVMAAFTVTNGLDSGEGSLRAAVALANADTVHDTILFAPGVNAVTLTSDQLTLSTEVTIAGPASGTVTVARSAAVGTPQFRIFDIETGAAASKLARPRNCRTSRSPAEIRPQTPSGPSAAESGPLAR